MSRPDPLVVYLPGVTRDRIGSPLLELAGEVFDRPLRSIARNVLRQRFTDGQIDDLLNCEVVTYDDVVAFLRQYDEGDGAPSDLRSTARGQAGEEPWPDPGAVLGPTSTALPDDS